MDTIDLRSDFLAHATDGDARRRARRGRLAPLRPARGPVAAPARGDDRRSSLGKEDALVFPTCTMANTVGAHAGRAARIDRRDASRARTCSRPKPMRARRWAVSWMTGCRWRGCAAVRRRRGSARSQAHRTRSARESALVVLENTHNRSGGVALPQPYVDEVAAVAARRRRATASRRLAAASTPPCALATTPAALAGRLRHRLAQPQQDPRRAASPRRSPAARPTSSAR